MQSSREPANEQVDLSDPAHAFEAYLRGQRQRRVPLPLLWEAFVAVYPSGATDTEKRERLLGLLLELAGANRLTLPASRSWERFPAPALPRFVTIPARLPQHPRTRALDVAWHPDLAWAATPHIDHDHRRFLEQVNLFLANGGEDRKVVPIRERSLELCGDEKHLERLVGTALFAPGRLTLELLRVERVFDPFAITRIAAGSLLLVVENATTYRTLCRHLPREGNTAVVGFGGGWQLPARIGFAADLDPPVTQIRYFGDLDQGGLRIPLKADAQGRTLGLPPVQPAAGLYRLLLQHGKPSPKPTRAVPSSAAHDLVSWLPTDLRTLTIDLLTSGQRIAQEWIGTDLLDRIGSHQLDRLVEEE